MPFMQADAVGGWVPDQKGRVLLTLKGRGGRESRVGARGGCCVASPARFGPGRNVEAQTFGGGAAVD
mgnify:CR=1 FL=1